MTFPLNDAGFASGLLSGLLFGYVLENAGFGSPRKLTAQFRFTDWSVFKVMFTAIIVAAIGLAAAAATGLLAANSIFIPTTYFWAMVAGGALIGAGMAIGGYCPGTSAVGLATGRLDSLFFMVGMVFGTALFAAFFEPMKAFYLAGAGPQGQTLSGLLGIPTWAVIGILVVIAVLGFIVGNSFERAHGGGLTAEQLTEPETASRVDEIDIVSLRLS